MMRCLRETFNFAEIMKSIAEFGGILTLGVFFPGKLLMVILLFFVVAIAELADIF